MSVVNIVYPIDGGSYPITGPGAGPLDSSYITLSFGVSCAGGVNRVKWGVDGDTLGTLEFYDQTTVQQVWKLPGGAHEFWVDASQCGQKSVRFSVGS